MYFLSVFIYISLWLTPRLVSTDCRANDVCLSLCDLWLVYLPLSLYIQQQSIKIHPKRLMVGIAGCAAAGKSTLALTIQRLLILVSVPTACISMDG